MTELETTPAEGSLDYRTLGLTANPFTPLGSEDDGSEWMGYVMAAAVNSLHAAVARVSGLDRPRPVWLELSPDIPDFYNLRAENAFLASTTVPGPREALALSIPLETMRWGRTRGTLAELAETVAAVDFDLTLAALAKHALLDADESLPEWESVASLSDEVLEALSTEPSAAVERYFGTAEYSRMDDSSTDAVMHLDYVRQIAEQSDPDQADEDRTGEVEESDDPALAPVPISEVEGASEEEVATNPVADYVIAYARAHVSPVVARAVERFIGEGAGFVAQELRVTKAPRKTMKAIGRLIRMRWDRLVVVYDRMDPWPALDEKGRSVTLTGLSDIRWALADSAIMVLMARAGLAPELEEQFAAADRVVWDMKGISELFDGSRAFDPDVVQAWLDAASLDGRSPISVADPLIERLVEAAENDIYRFCELAREAFDDAAARGASGLDEAAVEKAVA